MNRIAVVIALTVTLLFSGCFPKTPTKLGVPDSTIPEFPDSATNPTSPESQPPLHGYPFVEILAYETKFTDPQPITLHLKNTGLDAWFYVRFYTMPRKGTEQPKLVLETERFEASRDWSGTMTWNLSLNGTNPYMRVETVSCSSPDPKTYCIYFSSAELWY